MSRIDAYLPPQDELSPGSRRLDAANQRDNWLRQMELAQMAQMGATPAASAQPARLPAAQLPPAPLHAPLRAAENHERAALRQTADDMERDDAAAAPDTQAAASQAAQHVSKDDTQAAVVEEAAMTVAAQAAAALAPAPVAQAAQDRAAASLPATAAAALPATVLGAALPAGAQSPLAEGFTAMQAAPPGAAAALRAQAFLPAASADAPEAASAEQPTDAPAAGADSPGEAPDWQKRMMHLTGDGDDVKLWIRDGELSPSQSQQLVARLAADVAAMGLRLKEATVNGKPALRAAGRDKHVDAEAADGAAYPEPITHPTTER